MRISEHTKSRSASELRNQDLTDLVSVIEIIDDIEWELYMTKEDMKFYKKNPRASLSFVQSSSEKHIAKVIAHGPDTFIHE